MAQDNFKDGVVYSRGPLVKGILKGIWLPGVVVFAALVGTIWYKTQTTKTLLSYVHDLKDTSSNRERARILFDLTKLLQADTQAEERQEVYQALKGIVHVPHYFKDEFLMRYVALLAGLLNVDPEIQILKVLGEHPAENVRSAAVTSFAYLKAGAGEHADWFQRFFTDSSLAVKNQVVSTLDRLRPHMDFSESWLVQLQILSRDADPALKWRALLLLAGKDWMKFKSGLLSMVNPAKKFGKDLEERVHENLQKSTLALMQFQKERDVDVMLQKLALKSRNLKIRKLAEKIIRQRSS